MNNENIILNEKDSVSNISENLSLLSLDDSILVPFYFSNNRFNSLTPINKNIRQIINKNIYSLLELINNERNLKNKDSKITIAEYEYKEPYEHIDFKNKKHPFSYLLRFNDSDYLNDFFNGFDIHIYYDEDHDNVSGGVSLHINKLTNCLFKETLKQVYISNFIEYFLENYFIPELAATFPELIIAKTLRALDSHIDIHKSLNTQAHILSKCEEEWKKLVEEKFASEHHDYMNNELFDSLINNFLLVINFINAIRISIIQQNDIKDQFKLKINTTYSANRFLYDYDLLYNCIMYYKQVNSFESSSKDLTVKKFKEKGNLFNQLKISFLEIFYFHHMIFKDEVRHWINDGYSNNDVAKKTINKISFIINSTLSSEKFMLSIKSKNFIKLHEFFQIAYDILSNENFINENIKDVRSARFYSNSHFSIYNIDNYILLTSTERSLTIDSSERLNFFYTIGFLYFGAHYIAYKELESYASFVITSGYKNKNFAYRRIIRDLRIIMLDLFENYYGVNSFKYIVKQADKQYDLSKAVDHLIERVRKEDEADKLMVERNSIATAFICALFVGIIWFVDQCFASLQSTGSGDDSGGNHYSGINNITHREYTNWTIGMNVIYGFIGLATFITFVITIILIYQCIKIYVTYRNTKNNGLKNIY